MRIHFIDFYVIGRDVVIDVKTAMEPTRPILLIVLEGPERGLHTVVKERIALREVDDVDPDHVSEVIRVLHSEVEPLEVARTICVIPDPKVVLDERSLPYLIDVAAFEFGVELDVAGLVLGQGCRPSAHVGRPSEVQHLGDLARFAWQLLLIFLPVDELLVAWIPHLVEVDELRCPVLLVWLLLIFAGTLVPPATPAVAVDIARAVVRRLITWILALPQSTPLTGYLPTVTIEGLAGSPAALGELTSSGLHDLLPVLLLA